MGFNPEILVPCAQLVHYVLSLQTVVLERIAFMQKKIVIKFANDFLMTGYVSLNIANDCVSIHSIIHNSFKRIVITIKTL